MTDPRDTPGEPDQPDLRAAVTDLARLRELLLRVSRGHADVGEVRPALQGYWRAHEAELTLAARSVAEQVRLSLLQSLYRWRAQLQEQLPRRPDQ